MKSFHIQDIDKAIQLLEKWGYNILKPSPMDELYFQVAETHLFLRGYPSRQADVQLESSKDNSLYQRLKRRFDSGCRQI